MAQDISVKISYNHHIDDMPIEILKNLRRLSSSEKAELYESMQFSALFTSKDACNMILELDKPHIIMWFSNHTGNVCIKGSRWYRDNIFIPLADKKDIFYWLIDLTAWRYLSLKEAELVCYTDYHIFKNNNGTLSRDECPLVNDYARVLEGINRDSCSNKEVIRSADFFRWLLGIQNMCDVIGDVAEILCRGDIREGAAHFTLEEIGFAPLCLHYYVAKVENTLLQLDQTQVFPFLQYLEMLYYIYSVALFCMRTQNDDTCNIVLLIPNKEFTYYIVDGEGNVFENFRHSVEKIMKIYLPLDGKSFSIHLHILPFAYENDFYAGPFDDGDVFVDNSQYIKNILTTRY
jgi:hypothetical protein